MDSRMTQSDHLVDGARPLTALTWTSSCSGNPSRPSRGEVRPRVAKWKKLPTSTPASIRAAFELGALWE